MFWEVSFGGGGGLCIYWSNSAFWHGSGAVPFGVTLGGHLSVFLRVSV